MTLFDFLRDIYDNILDGSIGLNEQPYYFIQSHNFDDLISNDDLCFSLIEKIIDQDGYVQKKFSLFNKNRASHIIVTWLLGVGLAQHLNLNKSTSDFNNRFFSQIWLLSAIIHDYGYFKKELSDSECDLNKYKEYYLLTNSYADPFLNCLNGMERMDEFQSFFSYSYDEILGYFDYSKDYHLHSSSNANHEMCDHGIVGACAFFNEYCKKCVREIKTGLGQSEIITRIHKISCIIAASHNIFKSDSETIDKVYKEHNLLGLLSTSPIRVKKDNNILMLLSLVDTVECTKRFSAKENPQEYLQQKTVLNKIGIEMINGGVELDYDELFAFISKERKSKNMANNLKGHLQNIGKLNTWTEFESICFLDKNKCQIKL